jgi:sialate O-acetylesterase
MKKTVLLLTASLLQASAFADVRLPNIFGDNMVLQRDKPIPVWGWADKNEKVTVTFNDQAKTVKADKNGQWKVVLSPVAAGDKSYTLTVKGKNSVALHDIVMGDVWICSGQSNMEWPVRNVVNADKEVAQSANPAIRHFYLPKEISPTPKDDVQPSAWKAASPENTGDFTAVGYFFAKSLNEQLHVPIGLIHTSWGGTMVETWISREGMANSSTFNTLMKNTPVLNLDSLGLATQKKLTDKVNALQGQIPDAATASGFKNAAYNDGNWPKMNVPAAWESRQLKDFDGVAWFRKTINISAEDAGKAATLSLGSIDDNDVTYVNGVQVGSTNDYSALRNYTVPAGVLKEGKNVIAVRIQDNAGNGGFCGQSADMFININNHKQSLAGEWPFQIEAVSPNSTSVGPNNYPNLLYNAMIHPILQVGIKGAIWYQGETNAGRAYEYRESFPLMIKDWRKLWQQGDFPFYFVQLASFNANNGNSKVGSSWAELREAQTMTLKLPNTGMAVITDIGEPKDIHPRNKQDVGKRLAAVALNNTYQIPQVNAGPTYQSMSVNGNRVTITYSNTGSGLTVNDKYGYIKGFEIAGADKQFHYAKAYLDGNKVIVFSEEVPNPEAVRFGWADNNLEDNLFNKEGFPAAPFRTDDWKGITEDSKFAVQL